MVFGQKQREIDDAEQDSAAAAAAGWKRGRDEHTFEEAQAPSQDKEAT